MIKEELKEENLINYLNVFFFILISLMFYLYFALKYKIKKDLKAFQKEFSQKKEEKEENIKNINDMICIFNMTDCQFKNYMKSNRIGFKVSIDINVKGQISDPKKIIFFFDNNFHIKYKSYLNNYLNAAPKEQIRSIYRK